MLLNSFNDDTDVGSADKTSVCDACSEDLSSESRLRHILSEFPIERRSKQDLTRADEVLRISLDVAEHLLRCGGEIQRVETTVECICRAEGAVHVEIFCITSLIVAAVRMDDNSYSTQIRRIYSTETNLCKLEMLNAVSRDLCAGRITLSEAEERIRTARFRKKYPIWLSALAYMFTSASFTIFFGGSYLDGAASTIVGLFIYIFSSVFGSKINKFANIAFVSTVAGSVAIFLSFLFPVLNVDLIMIGSIMLLIPGLSFGSSLRDMLFGDTISGMARMIEAVILAATIALGYSIPLILFGGIL